MGVYMSKPVKEKESSDLDGKLLKCGASSMQGWRVSQEDAHNCCVEFDGDISLFAVYDGHGGHEVAEYASSHLPNVIKENESYKKGDYETALVDSFLEFDATLKSEAVMAELQKIAKEGKKSKDGGGDCAETDDEEEEETAVDKLREEANMPLAEVIAMYANGTLPKTPRNKLLGGPSKPMSPFLRAAKSSGSSSIDSEVSSSGSGPSSSLINGDLEGSSAVSKSEANEAPKSEQNGCSEEEKPKASEPPTVDAGGSSGSSSSAPEVSSSSSNGEVGPSSTTQEEPAPSSSSPKKPRRDPSAPSGNKELTSSLLDSTFASDDEEDSDNDETFQANEDASSSDEDVSHLNGSKESEEDDEEGEEEDEEMEDESDDEEDEDEDDGSEILDMKGGPEEPGMDSGCTAVVALITKDKLYVANAGDSRAVLSRNGVAVDLSVDHKPEDAIELKRIQKAGGKVTNDGRVNGGLNLSRALGDHFYKKSADLDAREQMITALPDVVVESLDRSTDEFIVLACDGIWNSMSSQEVVDFVRPLVQKGETLSSICEKLFETCLAPDTLGDGTGCDNMTCVIVKLLPVDASAENSNKRPSPDPVENETSPQPESKKPKLTTES